MARPCFLRFAGQVCLRYYQRAISAGNRCVKGDVQLSVSAYLAKYTSLTYSVVLASLRLLRTSPEKD